MQVGGRRALVIPADMAYGSYPPPGSIIEEGESLIFVVDLIGLP
jgi:FKBP-type peptidyl-prolyl cis-trans isomerase